jgi:hypothetical protein
MKAKDAADQDAFGKTRFARKVAKISRRVSEGNGAVLDPQKEAVIAKNIGSLIDSGEIAAAAPKLADALALALALRSVLGKAQDSFREGLTIAAALEFAWSAAGDIAACAKLAPKVFCQVKAYVNGCLDAAARIEQAVLAGIG